MWIFSTETSQQSRDGGEELISAQVEYLCTKITDPSRSYVRDDRAETAVVKTGTKQERRMETCGSSVLLCLSPAHLVLCPELRSLRVKDSLICLCCSSWPGAPMAQPILFSASWANVLIPALNGQELAPQQLWVTPNISVLNCAIATSALSALTNFTCVWETELSSAGPHQDLGTRVIPGSYSCWYSMRPCPGNNQWAGGQS